MRPLDRTSWKCQPSDVSKSDGHYAMTLQISPLFHHYKSSLLFTLLHSFSLHYILKLKQIFAEGIMSSSSSVSVSSEFTEFSSTSNESTGRVIETNKNANPALSPETVSCLNSSSKDGVDVEVEEREEVAEQKLSLRRGYEWVNPKVREYFSRYQFSSTLRNFLSKIYVYSPDATEEIISFR